MYVDVRTPETPPGCWHRVWAVTRSWVEANVGGEWAVVPPLLVVADGTPAERRRRVDEAVQGGWRLLVRSATLLPAGHQPVDW